jgi:hypothetical protein
MMYTMREHTALANLKAINLAQVNVKSKILKNVFNRINSLKL